MLAQYFWSKCPLLFPVAIWCGMKKDTLSRNLSMVQCVGNKTDRFELSLVDRVRLFRMIY